MNIFGLQLVHQLGLAADDFEDLPPMMPMPMEAPMAPRPTMTTARATRPRTFSMDWKVP